MGRKSKYTLEQKVKAVEDYKNGTRGTMQICKDLNMREINLYKWIAIYDDFGEIGFLPKERNKSYTADFKATAVNEYFADKGSYDDIARKYEIPSSAILKRWVSKYNGYEKLKDYNPKGENKRIKKYYQSSRQHTQISRQHRKR